MMNIIHLVVLFPWFCWALSCYSQQADTTDTELLRAEVDQWMFPYRSEKREDFAQWFNEVQQGDAGSGYQHPLYKHMQQLYDQHRDRYIRVRLESLRRYTPAPVELPGYEPVRLQHITPDVEKLHEKLAHVQDLTNIRTLDADDTRMTVFALLRGPVTDYLIYKRNVSRWELSDKMRFGNQLFVDETDEYRWKITLVNRLYAMTYWWDIRTNRVDGLDISVYTGDRQEPGWLQDEPISANTPRLQLVNEKRAFRWALYDQLDPEYDPSGSDYERKMQEFINAHRNASTRVREQSLGRLPKPSATWWENYTEEKDSLLLEELRDRLGIVSEDGKYRLSPEISFVETDGFSELLGLFRFHLARIDGTRYYDDWLIRWLTGDDVYVREIAENEWEIVGFSGSSALHCRWIIATDEMKAFTCWRKK